MKLCKLRTIRNEESDKRFISPERFMDPDIYMWLRIHGEFTWHRKRKIDIRWAQRKLFPCSDKDSLEDYRYTVNFINWHKLKQETHWEKFREWDY